MRDDDLNLPEPPSDDRPGDRYLSVPSDDPERSTGENTAIGLSWTGTTRLVRNLVAVGIVAVVCLVGTFVPQATLFKPGELSAPHKQILAGEVNTKRCASCHTEAALSPLSWFRSAGVGHEGVEQTDLCLDCHHKTIAPSVARSAHNLPVSIRSELTRSLRFASTRPSENPLSLARWIPNAAVDQNNVECNACHREHHGTTVDLTAMTNTQCQTCHSVRFDSFADSHPDWDRWPYGRGGEISFDHRSHSQQHFAGAKTGATKFDCARCHPFRDNVPSESSTGGGELVRSTSYEASCQQCHDDALNLSAAAGLSLLALPSFPDAIADQVNGWPESATGFLDGELPPLMELLLRADSKIASRLHTIPAGDLKRMDARDEETSLTLRLLGHAIKKLHRDVQLRGQPAVQERLQTIGISRRAIRQVVRSIPPQLAGSDSDPWFPANSNAGQQAFTVPLHRALNPASVRRVAATGEDLAGGVELAMGAPEQTSLLDESLQKDSLLEDPLLEDPLAADPLSEPERLAANGQASAEASDLISQAGWYRDDLRLRLHYQGSGHADPVLIAMIEVFSELGSGDALKRRFFELPSVASCVECHAGAKLAPAAWKADPHFGKRNDFTRFAHRPHLSVSALGSCVYCHQIRPAETDGAAAASTQTVSHPPLDPLGEDGHEFLPLSRRQCAACHTAEAAGDRCVQCHRYHVEW